MGALARFKTRMNGNSGADVISHSAPPNPHSSRSMIDLRNIKKAYHTDAGPFLALKGIDMQIDKGEFVAVVGKSGSGKSTLINMFTGIDHPTEGEVVVAQMPIRRLDEGQMAQWRGRNLGIVFQFFQLLPTLTVIENVMIPMDLAGKHEGQRLDRAMFLLDQVGIADEAYKFPASISGGEQQRVAIARAVAKYIAAKDDRHATKSVLVPLIGYAVLPMAWFLP